MSARNRFRLGDTEIELPRGRISPGEIARVVRIPAGLQLALRAADSARAKLADAVALERQLVAEHTSRGTSNIPEPALLAATASRQAAAEAMRQARAAVAEARQPHVEAVTAALAPTARDVAIDLLDAIADLRAAIQTLNEIGHEIRRVGGQPVWLALPELDAVEQHARKLAG